MPRFVFLILMIGLGVTCTLSQDMSGCPSISVVGPATVPKIGEILAFTAKVEPRSPALAYHWTISYGEIVGGQGTERIKVRFPDRVITATVEVVGLPLECQKTASEVIFWDPPEQPIKIGVLKSLKKGKFESELRKFEEALRVYLDNQGYIFVGHGKHATEREVETRETTLRNALFRKYPPSFDASRITVVRYQPGANVIELWRVPPGARYPNCEECEIKPRRPH